MESMKLAQQPAHVVLSGSLTVRCPCGIPRELVFSSNNKATRVGEGSFVVHCESCGNDLMIAMFATETDPGKVAVLRLVAGWDLEELRAVTPPNTMRAIEDQIPDLREKLRSMRGGGSA